MTEHNYSICNLNITSNISLPLLTSKKEKTSNLSFHACSDKLVEKDFSCFHKWVEEDGEDWLVFGKNDSGEFSLSFQDLAQFFISFDKNQIDCIRNKEVSDQTLVHLFLDQVLPLWFSKQGYLVLHACSVVIDNQAAIFIGQSGSGKSTLATKFYKSGYQVLSDDFVLVRKDNDNFYLYPSYPSVRLWPEAVEKLNLDKTSNLSLKVDYNEKLLFSLVDEHLMKDKYKISKIYFLPEKQDLDESSLMKIESIKKSEIYINFFKNLFQLDVINKEYISHTYDDLYEFINEVEVKSLIYRKDFKLLDQVFNLIVEDING